MLPGIGSAQGRSWDKILRGFNCGWHCFSESFAFSYLLQQQLQQQSSVAVAVATPKSVDGSATCGIAWSGRRDPGVPTSPSHQTLFNLSFNKGGA